MWDLNGPLRINPTVTVYLTDWTTIMVTHIPWNLDLKEQLFSSNQMLSIFTLEKITNSKTRLKRVSVVHIACYQIDWNWEYFTLVMNNSPHLSYVLHKAWTRMFNRLSHVYRQPSTWHSLQYFRLPSIPSPHPLKGTVARDFLVSVFFMDLL
jgi:hypothetical protein